MTIKEEKRDLFTMPSDYALAHCISADFKLGAGIARNSMNYLTHVKNSSMCSPDLGYQDGTKHKRDSEVVQLFSLATTHFLILLLNATIGINLH